MKRAVVPVLAAAVLAGCTSNTGGSGERSTSPTPTVPPKPTTGTVTLAGLKVTATLPPGARFGALTALNYGGRCIIDRVDVDDSRGHQIAVLQLAPVGCERNGKPPMNGFLGLYATQDAVAKQDGAQQRTVPAGKLATFTERYVECTNSCTTFRLDVAVVFLTSPADPGHPTLNIIDTTSLDGTDNSGYSVADIAASVTSS
jgi:hypothetical protein